MTQAVVKTLGNALGQIDLSWVRIEIGLLVGAVLLGA